MLEADFNKPTESLNTGLIFVFPAVKNILVNVFAKQFETVLTWALPHRLVLYSFYLNSHSSQLPPTPILLFKIYNQPLGSVLYPVSSGLILNYS